MGLGLVSGGIALAYEVLWARELLNLLGSTTRASAATLAAFMAGLALGAWFAGRLSTRLARPLWIYTAAEGLLAIFGFSFSEILGQFAGTVSSAALALGVLAALLLVPTLLMGAVLPALAATLQSWGAAHPRYIAWLYGLNALGGALAASVIGFGALPTYGLAASEAGTAITGLLAAAAAAALGIRRRSVTKFVVERGTEPKRPVPGPQWAALVAALVLSGVAALGYEILWTRILVLVVGSSTNAFTLMLSLYLLGLTLGGLWIGRYLGRLQRPVVVFQHLQLGVAATALAGTALFGFLPSLALFGFAQLGTSPRSIAVINGIVAAAVILPPTVFIGASLPVAARLMEQRVPRRGRELGTALALVTAGNVIGVLATAFVVVPAIGLQRGVELLTVLNLAAAILLWIVKEYRGERRGFVVPAVALSAVLIAPAIPSWDRSVMTSGVFRQAPVYLALLGSADRLERAFAAYRTVYYREGSEAVVAVFDRPTLEGPPHRVLTIDGKVDASTGADMATQVLSGHLPFLFRPDARNALVIGLASGVTVGALARHPLEGIDVVEIEPAVVEASRSFDGASGAPLRDPRVKVSIDDGRRYLQTVSARYDVIVSEPSNPWLSMSARLFTREFFELVRDRLEPRGILVQWIPLYGLSTPQFQALLRTLLSVFPNLYLFHVAEGDLVAIASSEPVSVAPAALAQLFDGASRQDLSRIEMREPADLLARWVADGQGLRAVLDRGPLNTDDNGFLEFGSPWYLLSDTTAANLSLIQNAAVASEFLNPVVNTWLARAAGAGFLKAVAARILAYGRPALVRKLSESLRSHGRISDADLLLGDAASLEGKLDEAEAIWNRHDGPAFLTRRAKISFEKGEVTAAARLMGRVPVSQRSAEDNLLFALLLAGTDRADEALDVLQTTSADARSVAGIMTPFIKAVLLEGAGKRPQGLRERREFERRLDDLRRCLEIDGCREVTDSLLAWSRAVPPGISSATWEDFRQTLYVRVTRPLPLYLRGVTQLWLGERAAAHAALRTYLKLLPEPDPLSKAHALLAPVSR